MDVLDLGSLPVWTVSICASALLFCVYFTWPDDTFRKMGLKGPKPLPIFGNTMSFFTRSVADVDVENTSLYGKVHGTFGGRSPILVAGDPNLVKEILIKEFSCFVNRTPVKIIQRRPLDRMLTILSDDHWRHVRCRLSPVYSSGKLKQMLSMINNCVNNLASFIDKQTTETVCTKTVLSGFTMDVIAATAFGLDTRSLDEPDSIFLKNAKEFTSFGSKISPKRMIAILASMISERLGTALASLGISIIDAGSVRYMEQVVRNTLNSRSASECRQNFIRLCQDELVDIMQVSQDSIKKTSDGVAWTTKGLTEQEIISNSIVFLLGGHDTVSTFLSFFCYAMATNPEAQKKAYEEIVQQIGQGDVTYEKLKDLGYLDMCMDETLRMYPPALRLDRMCNTTTIIGGLRITKGMSVSIPVYAIHYNSDYWEDPQTFKPERFLPDAKAQLHPCAYLPFGAGPRNCIGMRLALLEAKAALARLLLKYEVCPCSDTPEPPLKLGVSIAILTPAKPIVLSFRRRQALSDESIGLATGRAAKLN